MEVGLENLHAAASILRVGAACVSNIPGIGEFTAHEMNRFARRLEDKKFTIALFGAFSAGKSSFANALLGESILPVSPNPTTAAINRILAQEPHHSHGTAVVSFIQ
jgi:predicted GTPase